MAHQTGETFQAALAGASKEAIAADASPASEAEAPSGTRTANRLTGKEEKKQSSTDPTDSSSLATVVVPFVPASEDVPVHTSSDATEIDLTDRTSRGINADLSSLRELTIPNDGPQQAPISQTAPEAQVARFVEKALKPAPTEMSSLENVGQLDPEKQLGERSLQTIAQVPTEKPAAQPGEGSPQTIVAPVPADKMSQPIEVSPQTIAAQVPTEIHTAQPVESTPRGLSTMPPIVAAQDPRSQTAVVSNQSNSEPLKNATAIKTPEAGRSATPVGSQIYALPNIGQATPRSTKTDGSVSRPMTSLPKVADTPASQVPSQLAAMHALFQGQRLPSIPQDAVPQNAQPVDAAPISQVPSAAIPAADVNAASVNAAVVNAAVVPTISLPQMQIESHFVGKSSVTEAQGEIPATTGSKHLNLENTKDTGKGDTGKGKVIDSTNSTDDSSDSSQSKGQSTHSQVDFSQQIVNAARPADGALSQIQSQVIAAHALAHEGVLNQRTPEALHNSTPQYAQRGDAASIQPGSSDSMMPGINTAQLIRTLSQSEMRVGMHSSEFGNVSIRTSISQQQMLAQISVDHGDLSQALSAHIPAMQAKLGHEYGLNTLIEIHDQGAALSSGTGHASQNDQAYSRHSARQESSSIPGGAEKSWSPSALMTASDGQRLDIRA